MSFKARDQLTTQRSRNGLRGYMHKGLHSPSFGYDCKGSMNLVLLLHWLS
jgi:hypothetical protein